MPSRVVEGRLWPPPRWPLHAGVQRMLHGCLLYCFVSSVNLLLWSSTNIACKQARGAVVSASPAYILQNLVGGHQFPACLPSSSCMLMTWRAQGEYVAVSRLETIYQANSKAIHQIYIYGNSLRSHLLAVVVPVGARPHTRVRIPFSDKPDK